MASEHLITFTSDTYELFGTLHMPDAICPPVVIGSHGLFANRNSPKQIALARACNRNGIAYFRFDHRGCGESQGDFIQVTSLQARCRDLAQAVDTIRKHEGVGSIVALFGSSFGGTVVLSHAVRHPTPTLITYAAPIDSDSIRHDNIRDNSGHPPSSSMLTSALKFDITSSLGKINDIFIAHSECDETVPAAHARLIHKLAGAPKKITLFREGDHRMSSSAHQQEFESHFIQWIQSSLIRLNAKKTNGGIIQP